MTYTARRQAPLRSLSPRPRRRTDVGPSGRAPQPASGRAAAARAVVRPDCSSAGPMGSEERQEEGKRIAREKGGGGGWSIGILRIVSPQGLPADSAGWTLAMPLRREAGQFQLEGGREGGEGAAKATQGRRGEGRIEGTARRKADKNSSTRCVPSPGRRPNKGTTG